MAEQLGVLRYRGKIGNVVGYVVNGKQRVRKAPESTGENASAGQKRQRARFSEIAPVAKAANEFHKQHLSKTLKTSAYNNFLAFNASYLRSEESSPEKIVFPHTFFSTAPKLSDVSLSGRTLSFAVPELADCKEILVVAYVPDAKQSFSKLYTEAGSKNINLPVMLNTGDTVAVYAQGANDGELTENSVVKVVEA